MKQPSKPLQSRRNVAIAPEVTAVPTARPSTPSSTTGTRSRTPSRDPGRSRTPSREPLSMLPQQQQLDIRSYSPANRLPEGQSRSRTPNRSAPTGTMASEATRSRTPSRTPHAEPRSRTPSKIIPEQRQRSTTPNKARAASQQASSVGSSSSRPGERPRIGASPSARPSPAGQPNEAAIAAQAESSGATTVFETPQRKQPAQEEVDFSQTASAAGMFTPEANLNRGKSTVLFWILCSCSCSFVCSRCPQPAIRTTEFRDAQCRGCQTTAQSAESRG
jgi:hypothetical protein